MTVRWSSSMRPTHFTPKSEYPDLAAPVIIVWRGSPEVGGLPHYDRWAMYLEVETPDKNIPKFVHVDRVPAPLTWFSALPLEVR